MAVQRRWQNRATTIGINAVVLAAPRGLSMIRDLMWSIQRSLIGDVFPSLRAVTGGFSGKLFRVYGYVDGPVTEKIEEDWGCATASCGWGDIPEFSNYPPGFQDETRLIRCDYPAELDCLDAWAFYRHEQDSDSKSQCFAEQLAHMRQLPRQEDWTPLSDLLLSTQHALLGNIVPSMRAVTVGFRDDAIRIISYFDGSLTEQCKEAWSNIVTRLDKDMGEHYRVDAFCFRCDYPSSMGFLDWWSYLRMEEPPANVCTQIP